MTDRIPLAQLTKASLDALYNELAALRQIARGYCPACGRGDAAPTVADWERERQRADQAEELSHRLLDQRQEMAEERYIWQERGDQAEAALERVRAFLARHEHQVAVSPLDVLALLNEPTPGSAATQATKPGPAAGAVGICELPHQTIAEEDACEQQRLAGVAAGTEATELATTARITDLCDRWVKAGPPPLGTSLARWWDRRLAELHAALEEGRP